jgi:hypothetical protein
MLTLSRFTVDGVNVLAYSQAHAERIVRESRPLSESSLRIVEASLSRIGYGKTVSA